ncbi:Clp protease N-terminal domain-containing protein [Streptomyces sp. DW26H14]|uniref:Clp protease N-terminal domain-containing protein n=1 Tax=Streptomyces sp. DW26H14 TaxID=3435395 RepID=UPI00403E2B4C
MPKINVYLPDDLAAAVKAADLPVSAICQKALREAVALVSTTRKAAVALSNPDFDPAAHPAFAERVTGRMTERLRDALDRARAVAQDEGHVDSGHLLTGILDTPSNLAVRLLPVLQADADDLRTAVAAVERDEASPSTPVREDSGGPSLWAGLTVPARAAIGGALQASMDLGHNYLGCEHLLIGIADERTGSGVGAVLREAGLTSAALKVAVNSAMTGFAHARQSSGRAGTADQATAQALKAVTDRLEGIEQRLTAADL